MLKILVPAACLLLTASLKALAAGDKGEAAFRDLYKELVETNTTLSSGSCTLAAERMAAHLKSAGFPDSDLHPFAAPDHPKEGGLVAVYPGRDPKLKAILLLAHIDVVEAKREDWARDPFKLVEENGTFYARGVHRRQGRGRDLGRHAGALPSRRTIGPGAPSSSLSPAARRPRGHSTARSGWSRISATDRCRVRGQRGGLGRARRRGTPRAARDPGGGEDLAELSTGGDESGRTQLAARQGQRHLSSGRGAAAHPELRVSSAVHRWQIAPTSPAWRPFRRLAATAKWPMRCVRWQRTRTTPLPSRSSPPKIPAGMPRCAPPASRPCSMRVTPPTLCRSGLAPTSTAASFPASRLRPCARSSRSSSRIPRSRSRPSRPADRALRRRPLTRQILAPVEKLAAEIFPGVPVVPILQPGATDGQFLNAAGIPTYGIEPLFVGPDLGHIHGLNEYVSVQSLLDCRDFLYRLVKVYSDER